VGAARTVNQPVEHGPGDRLARDLFVPVLDPYVVGDDGGSTVVAVVDFQELALLLGGERRDTQSSRLSSCTRASILSMRM
jgi:hypothetical protein